MPQGGTCIRAWLLSCAITFWARQKDQENAEPRGQMSWSPRSEAFFVDITVVIFFPVPVYLLLLSEFCPGKRRLTL